MQKTLWSHTNSTRRGKRLENGSHLTAAVNLNSEGTKNKIPSAEAWFFSAIVFWLILAKLYFYDSVSRTLLKPTAHLFFFPASPLHSLYPGKSHVEYDPGFPKSLIQTRKKRRVLLLFLLLVLLLLLLVLPWYCFGIFTFFSLAFCKPPYHPVSMTGWLPSSNSRHTTFAKHAAPKAAFTNADSPLTATTLSCFLSFHMPGHRLTTLGSLTKIPAWTSAIHLAVCCCNIRTASFPTPGRRQSCRAVWESLHCCWLAVATGRTSGSSTISPGTRSNIKFLLEENDLERNCWMLFDVPLQIKHYL